MFSTMQKHLSYANVAATLALVFSMSGAAVAANHYLINSTKQINPKVLKKLRGRTGPRGPQGPAGREGRQGIEGREGRQGREGSEREVTERGGDLAAGGTLRGDYAGRAVASEPGQAMQIPISFGFSLHKALVRVNYIPHGSPPPEGCFGSFHEPEASAGYLCVFESPGRLNVREARVFDPISGEATEANRFGAAIEAIAEKAGEYGVRGTWAVTAPY
jgi:hypothetical protein